MASGEEETAQVTAVVPAGAVPGETQMSVEMQDGNALLLRVPIEAKVGDTLVMTRHGDSGWAMEVREFNLTVPPDAVPGVTVLQIDIGGGKKVGLKVPQGVSRGEKLLLSMDVDGNPVLLPGLESQEHVGPMMFSDRLESTTQRMEALCSSIRSELLGAVDEVKEALSLMEQTILQEREARVKSFVELEARLQVCQETSCQELDKQQGNEKRDASSVTIDVESQDVFELHTVMNDRIGHHAEEIQDLRSIVLLLRSTFQDTVHKLEQRLDATEWRNECASMAPKIAETVPFGTACPQMSSHMEHPKEALRMLPVTHSSHVPPSSFPQSQALGIQSLVNSRSNAAVQRSPTADQGGGAPGTRGRLGGSPLLATAPQDPHARAIEWGGWVRPCPA